MSSTQPTVEHDPAVDEMLDGVRRLLLGGHPVRLVIDSLGSDPHRIALRVEQVAHGLAAAQVLIDRVAGEPLQA